MNPTATLHPWPVRLGFSSLLAICALSATAADRTWDGEDATSNWSAPANWDGNASAPVNGDNLIFTGFNQTANVNDIANLAAGWLFFDSGGYSISGNLLTLSGGITNSINAGGATVGMDLTLGASQAFVSAGGTLAFTGIVTNGGNSLTLGGDGDFTFSKKFVGSGASGLTKGGAGTAVLTGYSGSTLGNGGTGTNLTINGGVVEFASGYFNQSPFGYGALNVLVNSGATMRTSAAHALGGDNIDGGTSWGQIWLNGGTLELNREQYARGGTVNGLGRLVMVAGTLGGTYDLRTVDAGSTISTLASANSSTISCSGGVGIRGNLTLDVADGAAGDDLVITAELKASTTGGLIKANTGRVVLQGYNNTYVGNTVVNAGTLALGYVTIPNSAVINVASNAVFDVTLASFSPATNQTIAGAGTVLGTVNDLNPGAVIAPGGNGTAGTLTMDNLTLGGNLALNFDLSTNNTTVGGGVNDLLVVTNLTLASGLTNTVNISALGGLKYGVPYTLIKYVNGPVTPGAIAELAAPPTHFLYKFTNDTANSAITLTITANPYNLVWKGGLASNAWDITTTTNWLVNGVTPDMYYDGDNVLFSDLGSNTPPINLTTTVKPTIITNNSTKDYTFAGPGKISGGARLVKTGSGNLTILTENDNTGGGLISGGTVYVGANPAASSAGGATGNLGSGNLTNNAKVVISRSSTITYAGNMSGSGSVEKLGAGQLNITGSNTFSGGLLIQNGTVLIGANPTIAGSRVNGPITNYTTLFFSVTDPFTLAGNVTGAGNPYTFGSGDINIRGVGGMTVDGTASMDTGLNGALNVAQSLPGLLTIAAGGNVNVGAQIAVGNPGNTKGDVVQTGGTLSVGSYVRLGHWANNASSQCTYTLSGGTLNVPYNYFAVGWDGIGVMNMSGGTMNVRTLDVDGNGATAAVNGTNSTFNMTGGTLNIGAGGITGNVTNGIVRLSGGTIAAPTVSWTSSKTMILTNGTPTFDTAGNNITLTGVLSGNGGLVKQGAGRLQLDAVNTYTNATTVAAGVLQGSGTIAGPVVVQSGATLSAGGTAATGTLTVGGNVTLNAGAGIVVDASSTSATADRINATAGTVTLNATPIYFNFLGGVPFAGTYTVLSNTLPRSGSFSFVNPTRYALTDASDANNIAATFSGANASLVWSGNVNNLWNVNTDANWLNGASADKYFQSDAVIFNNTGIGAPNVTLSAALTPASVFVDTTGNYTLSGGSLTSVGSLTKNGTGTLTLANDSAFNSTYVNGGTLQIGSGGTSGTFAGNIANNGSVIFNRSDASTYAGTISGLGSLTVKGGGTLTLTGGNAHSGGSTVESGTSVQVGLGPIVNSGALGVGPVLNQGAITYYRTDASLAINGDYSGNGALTFQGTGVQGQSGYILNGANSFTGPVTLNLARLSPGSPSGLGSPSSITVNPGSQVFVSLAAPFNTPLTLSGSGWWESAGRLGALRLASGANWAGNITLAGNARISAHDNASSNVVSGTISGAKELETGTSASGFLSLSPSSPNSFSSLRLSPGTLWIDNANALPSTTPMVMNGGTLKLNGNNYSPSSYLNVANGTFQNGSASSAAALTLNMPYDASISLGTKFQDGGTQPLHVTINQSGPNSALVLAADSGTGWTGDVTFNGGVVTVDSGGNELGKADLAGRTVTFNNAKFNLSPNNAWSGSGALATMVLSNSTMTVTRFNSFGPFVLSGSTLTSSGNSDSAYYAMYNLNGGRVTVIGNQPSFMTGTPNAVTSHGFNLKNPTVFDVANVTGNSAEDLTVSAPLRTGGATGGSGGVVKIGAGKMLVTDVATYTGSTVVSNGILALSGSGSIASSASIIVASGATLDASALGVLTLGNNQKLGGSGTVIGGVSDASGSAISPGASAGTLTINGNLTLNGSGSLALEVANVTTVGGGVNDLIQVNGSLSLNDFSPTPVNFTFLNGAPAVGTYTIINTTGGVTSGTAAGLTNTQGYAVSFAIVGNAVQATFAAPPAQPLVWQGTGDATWNLSTASVNWSNTTANVLTNFYQLDSVVFNDSSVNTLVSMTEAVNPASITFNGSTSYTLDNGGYGNPGKITGSSTLTKNGTGTVAIHCENLAVGPINVNGGILQFNGDNADNSYAGATVITVANNAAFDFGSSADFVKTQPHSFVIQGSGPDGLGAVRSQVAGLTYGIASDSYISNFVLAADATIGGDQRWDIGPMAGSKVNGQGFTLTKTGPNGISLRTEIVTNLAALVITNGRIWYENYDRTNVWELSTTNRVLGDGRLGVYGGRTVGMPIELNAGEIYNEGGGTPTWTSSIKLLGDSRFNNSGAQVFAGAISGPGAMWINGGTATLTLSNAGTYAGGTILSNGVVNTSGSGASGTAAIILANPTALGTGALNLNGGAITANTITNTLRAVEFNLAAGSVVPNDIVLPTSLISNIALQGRDASSVFTLSGKLTGGHAGLTNWIDNGAGGVGVFRLSNTANDFVAGRTLLNRGTLAITGDGALGSPANALHLAGTLRFDAPGVNITRPVAAVNTSTIQLFGDNNGDGTPETVNNATISGTLSGSGLINFRGTNGVITLAGVNSCSGSLELVEPVTLSVGASANLGSSAVALKAGTLRYTGTGSETMTRTLWNDNAVLTGATIDIVSPTASLTWNPGGGTCNQVLNKTGPGALTMGTLGLSGGINANGGTWTINSVVSGAKPVNVNSGATLVLNGANTYSLPTTVNGGSLFVNGTTTASSPVTVSGTGSSVLGGSGTINGQVTVNAGASLQPGNAGIGTLTINNALSLAGSTTMEINAAALPANDSVAGLVSVIYGGTLNVNNLGSQSSLVAGSKFTLFNSVVRLGSFSTLNLPPLDAGLAWTNKLALDGSIEVYATSVTPPPATITKSVSGNQLTLSWPAGQGWRLLSQTNSLAVGLKTATNTWYEIAPAASNTVTVTISPTNPTVFFKLVYP